MSLRLRSPLLCFLTLLVVTPFARGAEEAPPNVVFIISDDHGWTDYGFMGSRSVSTPNLDRLAAQSLTFRRGTVPSSLCCPSLASLITGRYPHQHKITCNDPPKPEAMSAGAFAKSPEFLQGREAMNKHLDAVPTLPKLLANKGYRSLQTGKWWQGDYRRGGFSEGMTKGQRHGDQGLDIGRKTMKPIDDFIVKAQADRTPFFLWYAPMLPHQPHNPPERLLAKYRKQGVSIHVARYHAMIEWFDETIGHLLETLEKTGASKNTIVVYLADNGWTQSETKGDSVRSKRTPYDAGVRTPIMIHWPGHIKASMSEKPVTSVDIAPTILQALGLAPAAGMQGVNLLDTRAVDARPAIFGACFTHNAIDLDRPSRNLLWRWATDGTWKLILPVNPQEAVELYETSKDLTETKNLAKSHPDVVARLRSQLDGWWTPEP